MARNRRRWSDCDVVVPEWLPKLCRVVAIGLVAPPGVGTFVAYERSVRNVTAWGIPEPEVAVLVVRAIELVAVGLLLVDRGRLLAVVGLAPVMLVARWSVGEWQALAVLVALLVLAAVDLGRLEPGDGAGEESA
jgi:uncharacterized membrane protein YphA (DoxX/SURF4 family)